MPTLFLVDGAAGSGKTDFIQHFCKKASRSDACVIKYTTKTPDSDGIERPDLHYCSSIDEYIKHQVGKKDSDYFEYNYPENDIECRYMVIKKDIDKELYEHDNVYLIVRSVEVIKSIQKVYESYLNVNVVTIFIYSDSVRLEKRVTAQCYSENITNPDKIKENVAKRLTRNAECLKSYIGAIGEKLYDYIILNDISYDEYHSCMQNIKSRCEQDNNKFAELTAFIIMPMAAGREWMHFNEVKKAIIAGARMQGFVAERQDDKNNPKIMDSIKDSINNALVCITDLTLSRPNCYYELGLADETHRVEQIVIIKQEGEPLAFDLQGRNCIDYTFHENDYSRISNAVSNALAQFKKKFIFMTKGLEEHVKRISKIFEQ